MQLGALVGTPPTIRTSKVRHKKHEGCDGAPLGFLWSTDYSFQAECDNVIVDNELNNTQHLKIHITNYSTANLHIVSPATHYE